MPNFVHSSLLDCPPEVAFDWHVRPGAFERLAPPWAPIHLVKAGGIQTGERTIIRLGWGPLSVRWVALHTDYRHGEMFEDVQEEGPFRSWRHRHRFERTDDGRCRLVDDIVFEPPLGEVGLAVGSRCLERNLREQFSYRHRILANDLTQHRRYGGRSLSVAITGSSGLLGSALAAFLTTGGHRVLRLVRREADQENEIRWSPNDNHIESEKLEGLDAVVHLAGESLFAPRWTAAKKRRIYDSRIVGTTLLSNALAGLKSPPRVFVSSSAIGIYGDRGHEVLTEQSEINTDGFLAQVCVDWEAATSPAKQAGIRTVHPRTGIVISGAGGALAPMLPLFKAGLGGRFGIPDAYLSWIALDDVLGGIYHAIQSPDVEGAFNLTAPGPVTWDLFAAAMGEVLDKPTFVTVPEWLIRLGSGEVAENVILPSTRAVPDVLLTSGYPFLFADLREALRHQLGRSTVS